MAMMRQYYLVSFQDGTAIVPDCWIESGEKEIVGGKVKCAYPTPKESKYLRKYVSSRVAPGSLWETHKGEILLFSDDLEYLRKKAQKYEAKESLSTTDCDEKRERPASTVYTNNNCVASLSPLTYREVSSSEESSPISTQPPLLNDITNTLISGPSTPENAAQDKDKSFVPVRDSLKDVRSSSLVPSCSSIPSCSSTPINNSNATSNLNFSKLSIQKTRMDIEKKLGCSLTSTEGLVNLLVTQQLLLSKQTGIIEQLGKKVDELLPLISTKTLGEPEDDSVIQPIRNFEEYFALISKITDDARFRRRMMRFLACGGGTNVTDAVGRAFSKLLTHDMQVKVTMSGSNMKERILEELGLLPQGKFSFADTFLPTFIKAIRLVFKDNPPTEQEVQSAASSFLRRATDREGGRERRRKSAEKKAQTANSRNGNVTQPPPKKKRLCLDESDSDSA